MLIKIPCFRTTSNIPYFAVTLITYIDSLHTIMLCDVLFVSSFIKLSVQCDSLRGTGFDVAVELVAGQAGQLCQKQ